MNPLSLYRSHRFRLAVISLVVRWHFRFSLSLRYIEEFLLKGDVVIGCESISRWCNKFVARFAHQVKVTGRKASVWHLDKMCVRLRGEPYWLWRCVDEHGCELDVLLKKTVILRPHSVLGRNPSTL